MPEPEERFYNIERLNMIFAITSSVLLVVLVWMVADDYSREWKNYQRDFRALEIEKTRVKYDYAENELKVKEEYRSIEDQLKQARQAFDANCGSTFPAAEQKKLAVENDLLNQKYKFTKAEYDAARYRYETAKANGSGNVGQAAPRGEPRRRRAQKDFDETGLKLASLKSALDRSSQQLADQEKTADECGARLKDLERRERAFQQKTNILKRKLVKIDPNEMNFTNRVADMVRDLPIIDLANPNFKLQQIVLKDIPDDLNFAKVPRVDRCVTCHLGITNPDYKDVPQPFTTHPGLELYLGNNSAHPLDDFGCTVCHGGRGRGTDFTSAAHTPSSPQQTVEWEKKYRWHPSRHWEKPMLPKPYVEAGCFQCHSGQTVIKGAEKLNLGLNLIEKAGCYACHEIERYKNWPKPGPDLTRLSSKVSKSWAYRWIEDPHAFRPNTWMPAFFKQSNTSDPQSVKRGEQEIHAIVAYLFQDSGEFAQNEIPSAGDPRKGKELVASVGCLGCHRIDPLPDDQPATRDIIRQEHGPNLIGVGSKTSNKWIYNWLKDPHAYNPDTKMPDLRLSDQEAADIGAYLVSFRADMYDKTTIPPVDEPVLNEITVDFLKKTETDGAAREKLAAMSLEEKLSYSGLRLIRQYGCFSCHNIAGFEKEKPVGTALTEEGSRPVERLDFGFVPLDHTREAWFLQKLKDPRIFDQDKVKPQDEKLRMPNFHFSDEEAGAVTAALLGFVKEVPEAKIVARTPRNLAVERGQQLVRTLNCQGCHVIEKEGGAIQPTVKEWLVDYNDTSENEAGAIVQSFSPPNLVGEGKKVQSAWLFHFLHEPTTVRPWLKVRMPTYALETGELNDLVRYFAALDGEDALFEEEENIQGALPEEERQAAEKLFGKDYFDCAKCHIVGSHFPGGSPENWAPDFALAKSRLRAEWVIRWLTNPQDLLPGTKMPTYFDPVGFDAAGPEDILGGDEHKQIRALRNYLMSLTPQADGQTTP